MAINVRILLHSIIERETASLLPHAVGFGHHYTLYFIIMYILLQIKRTISCFDQSSQSRN